MKAFLLGTGAVWLVLAVLNATITDWYDALDCFTKAVLSLGWAGAIHAYQTKTSLRGPL